MGKLLVKGLSRGSNVANAPPSKAFTLRYLVASALSVDWARVIRPNWGDDTWSMLNGVRPISSIRLEEGSIALRGLSDVERYRVVDVGESGFTLRVLTGVYSAIDGVTYMVPRGTLASRPMEPLIKALRRLNVDVNYMGSVVRVTGGRVRGGFVEIEGSVSSQYITSLMYMAPLTEEGIEIHIKPPIKSRPYIEATAKVLGEYGISTMVEGNVVRVEGGQAYKPRRGEVHVPGDYALSAFYMSLAALAGVDLEIVGLSKDASVEGEYSYVPLARSMGIELIELEDRVVVKGSSTGPLRPLDVDLSDSPDIAMPLALLMAKARGRSRIRGVEHLVHKESNRLISMAKVLECLGASVAVNEGAGVLEVEGVGEFKGGCMVSSYGDHRIVMMGVVGGAVAREPIIVDGWEDVFKSWPTFIFDMQSLGVLVKMAS